MDSNAKKKAIEYHYDVGNDFYSQWLDTRMVYSCALWLDDDNVGLEEAQTAKLDWHLKNLGPDKPRRILDIGCGWGSLLQRHNETRTGNSGVGLTLSSAQKQFIDSTFTNVDVHIESWTEHEPHEEYDGIVSIGAFEHFADNKLDLKGKLQRYDDFFSRCHSWLSADSNLCLQTITYKEMLPEEQNSFFTNNVFPDSELPILDEIYQTALTYFTLVEERFDGEQYARTCDIWLERLRKNKAGVIASYGNDIYDHYVKYLKYCVIGFYANKLDLARFVFSPKN